jgi:hypothetical protein
LVASEDGRVIRVKGTRVTLDTLIGAFKRGATPEEIVQGYTALSLAEVYAVITFYLRHRCKAQAPGRRPSPARLRQAGALRIVRAG